MKEQPQIIIFFLLKYQKMENTHKKFGSKSKHAVISFGGIKGIINVKKSLPKIKIS
jgi:hypothetical protein